VDDFWNVALKKKTFYCLGCTWEDNIKMEVNKSVESTWTGYFTLLQGKETGCCEKGNEPLG
jgi:hypothetical protein